jgi:glycosyltransferase involved in cell wall biosynthesis
MEIFEFPMDFSLGAATNCRRQSAVSVLRSGAYEYSEVPTKGTASEHSIKSVQGLIGRADLDLSVVIPVYRSASTVEQLICRISTVLASITQSYEIVLVEDCSPDETWQTIERVQLAYDDHVVAVQLMRNYGQHNALMCGLRLARGRIVVTMDDDLQNPPEEIPKLLDRLEDGTLDLVYGTTNERQHAGWRNLGASLVWRFYQRVFGGKVRPTPFRAMRRELAHAIQFYDLNFTYLDGLLAWCTTRIGEAVVEHHPRAVGSSSYSLSKLLVLALNLYTNFSLLPLQIVSLVGFVAALGGFSLGAYYILLYFTSSIAVPGFASTIVAVLVLGGVQLLALGVIGEYLGRLHLNVNRKPQYIIRQIK